jgi:tetratricopeptide (TPR) repeat protein
MGSDGDCPTESTLARVLEGGLSADEHADVMRHVGDCARCRHLMSAVQGLSGSSTRPGLLRPEPERPRGTVLGRYVLLDRIGAGAVGVVYAAYDPQLDRRVALKLLSSRAAASPSWHDRMLREARAMAAIRHPNVLTIHDVGQHEEGIFIAMELIEGWTLSRWLAEDRTVNEVLWVFAAAGRGLAAAHERGLVHRDFKPDNLLLGSDGRVLVSDFGLARFCSQPESGSVDLGDFDVDNLLDTRTGALVGTPAYMAPEQLSGEAADARSDQFSFCVTLYEALYGIRPFRQETLPQMRAAMRDGQLEAGEPLGRVPARVRAALARGLSYDPDDRHSSMEALLHQLDGPSVGRYMAPALAIAGVAVGAAVTTLLAPSAKAERSCEDLGRVVDATWNAPRRANLERIYGNASPDSLYRLATRLDEYADQWRAVKVETCQAEQTVDLPPATIASRDVCLYRIQLGYRMLLDELERSEEHTVFEALEAVARLPSPARCTDLEASDTPPSFAAVSSSTELEETLARAEAAWTLGHRDTWEELATHALDLAEARDDTRGRIRAHIELALAWSEADTADAEAHLRRAITMAVRIEDHALASKAWAGLAFVQMHGRRSLQEAKLALDMSDSEASHIADDDGNLIARLHHRSDLAILEGRFGDALELLAEQENVNARLRDPLATLAILDQRGSLAHQRGKALDAVEASERTLDLLIELLGPESPDVRVARINLGMSHLGLGHYAEAVQAFELLESGPLRTARRAVVEFSHGDALYGLGRFDEAMARYDESLELLESLQPTPANRMLELRMRRVNVLLRLERPDDAERELAAAEPLVAESGSPLFEYDVLAAKGGLALERGQLSRAGELLERAESAFLSVEGEQGFGVGGVRCQLGQLALRRHDRVRATAYLEQSASVLTGAPGPDVADCLAALDEVRSTPLDESAAAH